MVSVNSASGQIYANTINRNDQAAKKSLNQIGSGKAINKASDNAAGLAIATQLMTDVSSLRQSSTNLIQGTSILQTADGALEQSSNILNRMKELATQSNSGSLDANARNAINQEYQSLSQELNDLSSSTTFNGQSLVNGTYNNSFQAGVNGTDTINADLTSVNISSAGLGLTSNLTTQAGAMAASGELDAAINAVSSARSRIGAELSTFSTRGNVLETQTENTIAAQSAIMDADIGASMTEFIKSKNLSEVSIAAAAQGNQMKSSMLKLVR
jgi:flagellin